MSEKLYGFQVRSFGGVLRRIDILEMLGIGMVYHHIVVIYICVLHTSPEVSHTSTLNVPGLVRSP